MPDGQKWRDDAARDGRAMVIEYLARQAALEAARAVYLGKADLPVIVTRTDLALGITVTVRVD